MQRKGISPIVSSVLLLAVALTVVSIFSGWAPNIIRTATDETTNQTEQTINCNRAGVEVLESRYFSENTSVVARNTGRSDLEQLEASAWQDDLPMNKTTFSLESGNFTTVNVSTSSKPDYVEVVSKDCSSVTDRLENIE